MKKIVIIVLALIVICAGCSLIQPQEKSNAVVLDTNESLAFSAYMASGLLSSDVTLKNQNEILLFNGEMTDTMAIETELEDVNVYFNKLKAFMNQGVENALQIQEKASEREGYTNMFSFTIEEKTYTVHYSMTYQNQSEKEEDDEQEFILSGIMILDEIEYEITGASEIEEDEQKMWFETIDKENSGNKVRIERKTEEDEQKFEIETTIGGVKEMAEIKFENEEDEQKVELKLKNNGSESCYEFKREIEENNEYCYKFEYQIGNIEGEVKITETADGEGNYTYRYEIKEEGKAKSIEKANGQHKKP